MIILLFMMKKINLCDIPGRIFLLVVIIPFIWISTKMGNFRRRESQNKAVWISHTAVRYFREGIRGTSILDQEQELHTGEYLTSPNEQAYLIVQSYGHLSIYTKRSIVRTCVKINEQLRSIKYRKTIYIENTTR